MMSPQYTKLLSILSELFQLDQAELDFGIYRIMNAKRHEINDFLQNRLLTQVRTTLEGAQAQAHKGFQDELDKLTSQLQAAGVDPATAPKVKELQQALANADTGELENEVFNHLASFFRRYYSEGDFISMRRYKKDVYALPYEGEEVKLHWANADQYYIKTSEYFTNYRFTLPDGRQVQFALREATTEQNNNKAQAGKERRFRLAEADRYTEANNQLTIWFTYMAGPAEKQADLNAKAIAEISRHGDYLLAEANTTCPEGWRTALLSPAPTPKNPQRTLLEKHLNDYTARNTFDYFIHKDLGGFLRRELDFYLKNEVLQIDDIDTDDPAAGQYRRRLRSLKAIRTVANDIIALLAQIEDFQKSLWLKKKLVLQSDYCITLDRIPESFYPTIAACEAQRLEWEKLYHIQDLKGDAATPGFSVPLTEGFLRSNPFLLVDTQFYSVDFKYQLLAALSEQPGGIDASTDGLLINSENFQALNLLQVKYREKVDCVYIDPPYNTNATLINYKNEFKHSSWLSLIENRLELSWTLMRGNSIICATIDDYELANLNNLMNRVFGREHLLANVVIRNNPSGRSTVKGFSVNHEYGLFYAKNSELAEVGRLPHSEKQSLRYDNIDEEGERFEWENFRKSSAGSNRQDRPKQYFPIILQENTGKLRIPEMQWDEQNNSWRINEKVANDEVWIWPINEQRIEKVWQFGVERTRLNLKEFKVINKDQGYQVYKKKFLNEDGILPRTWWESASYSARDNGSTAISNFFGDKQAFDFPKSVFAVIDSIIISGTSEVGTTLDYFGGSGTTGHAVISLNRQDGGKRKYILVEMGEYFDTVTKPRIQKVVYSAEWKDGKPLPAQGTKGVSHCFQYLRLESYEDVLNNLQLPAQRPASMQDMFAAQPGLHKEYMLHYMLNAETGAGYLPTEAFASPFGYKINATRNQELQETEVDLVATFNLLLGIDVLAVQWYWQQRGALTVEGRSRSGHRVLIIWRDTARMDGEALNKFLRSLSINTRDAEFRYIYVNGDNHLENIRTDDEHWKVQLIEEAFRKALWS